MAPNFLTSKPDVSFMLLPLYPRRKSSGWVGPNLGLGLVKKR
jgi:hypothetical protein